MSWQVYVDQNLVGTGKVKSAAIVGQSLGVWAKSPGFELNDKEQKSIVAIFKDKAGAEAAQATGITLAGTKYFTLQVDHNRNFYGKKGADGCILVKTKQAILVTTYSAPIQAAEVTPIVEALADYLIGVGY